jgi:hypothetical protein
MGWLGERKGRRGKRATKARIAAGKSVPESFGRLTMLSRPGPTEEALDYFFIATTAMVESTAFREEL